MAHLNRAMPHKYVVMLPNDSVCAVVVDDVNIALKPLKLNNKCNHDRNTVGR